MVADRCQWINICPLRNNLSLRAHLTPNWPQIFTKGWRFPVRVGLGPLSLVPTDDVIKYVKKHPKTTKNDKKEE